MLLKKFILLISAMLACAAVSASAQESVSVAVKKTMESGNLVHRVVVSGSFQNPDDNVMLIVRNSNSDVTVLEQETTDENGSVAFEFSCNTADKYVGRLNSEISNQNLAFEFSVHSETEYNAIVEKFNSATKENISDIIAENASMLSLDTTYYTDEKKSEIESNMLGECGELTLFTINESFDKSVMYAYLFGNDTVKVKNEILAYYDSIYFRLAEQANAKKLYKSFLGFDETVQKKVYDRLAVNKPKKLTEFDEAFNEAVVLTAAAELDNTELDEFFIDNSDIVPLKGYESAAKALRNTYLNAIKKSSAKTIGEIVAAYNAAVQNENNKGGSSSSSGGGGGGGGNKVIGLPANQGEIKNNNPGTQPVKKGFSDLGGYEWAETAIKNLGELGIVKGKSEESFGPGDDITRAEFTTIVVRAFGLSDNEAECEFADVPKDHWSYPYVASGFSKGIINGIGENVFGGDEKITREQMAAILYRAIRSKVRIDVMETVTDNLKDFDTVSDYAKTSVLSLSNLKIINGFEDGNFYPQNNATRAEVSVMIHNALEVLGNA